MFVESGYVAAALGPNMMPAGATEDAVSRPLLHLGPPVLQRVGLARTFPLEHKQASPCMSASCGVRTHAEFPLVDLKSTPLTTRAN